MTFLKSSLLVSASTLVGIAVGLVSQKLYGIYLGPVGLAYLGNFINLVSVYQVLSSAGQQNGLATTAAQYASNPAELHKRVSAMLTLGLIFSGGLALIAVPFASTLSAQYISDSQYAYVFVLLGLTGFLFGQNLLFMSVLQGLKAVKLYVTTQIVMHGINLIFKVTLVVKFGLGGALVSIFLPNVISILVTLYLLHKERLLDFSKLKLQVELSMVKPMLEYFFMALVSFALLQVTQLIIRGLVISKVGHLEAGYWQAVLILSGTYLSFAGASVNAYYLPRLAPLTNRAEVVREVHDILKRVAPILVLFLGAVFAFRNLGLRLLFSDAFLPAESLFIPFIIGDFFRIISWTYALILVSKKLTLLYACTEIGFALVWVVGSLWAVQDHGIVGVSWVYAWVYFFYLVTLVILFYFTPLLTPLPQHEGADSGRL